MDSFKKWTTSAALLTKQYLGEKFGQRSIITSDPELEAQISFLYSSQDRYKSLLRQFSDLLNSFKLISSNEFSIAQCLQSLIDAEGNEDLEMYFSKSFKLFLIGKAHLQHVKMFYQLLVKILNLLLKLLIMLLMNYKLYVIKL